MLNISQVTNFDNLPIEGEYKIITLDPPAVKLGFCGDSQTIGKNIVLAIGGNEKVFEIGKSGIFEFQPEVWVNTSDDNDEEDKEIIVYVTEVKVPKDSIFTLDYCYYT